MTRTRAIDDRETLPGEPNPRRAARALPCHAPVPVVRLLVLGLLLCHAVVRADAAPRSYAIPPQSLNDALMDFAVQSDLELVVPADLIRGLPSGGLAGDYTPEQGLQALLAGTGIQYRLDGNTLTIERAEDPLRMAQASPETTPAEPEPAEDAIIVLPEITVTASPIDETSYTVPNATTATKTDTPIFDTPASIQVIPRQVIEDQQALRLHEVTRNVSGVLRQFDSGGATDDLIIRGFGAHRNLYRDGFLARDTAFDLANIEQVEVLKGPSAMLYGRLEPGGLVNQVTKRPVATPYYSLQQQFGSFNLYRTTLDATGPALGNESLLYRFNLAYENSDSFRDFVSLDRIFLAPSVTWRITNRTQVDFDFLYQDDDPRSLDNGIGCGSFRTTLRPVRPPL